MGVQIPPSALFIFKQPSDFMEDRKPVSFKKLFSDIQARYNKSIHRHGDGEGEYYEMVERIINGPSAVDVIQNTLIELAKETNNRNKVNYPLNNSKKT
jgi:hypothetical protein